MANDFSTDSRCKALWRFENNLQDSKGGNDLTGAGSPAITYVTDCQEGSHAADFENANGNYAYRADADLDPGFPLKSGDTTKKISVCFWVKPESWVSYAGLFTKWDWNGNRRSLEIQRNNNRLKINVGHTNGSNYQSFNTGIYLDNGQWYHVGVVVDGVGKLMRARVYKESTGDIYTFSAELDNELWVGDPDLVIGSIDGGGSSNYFDGILDEVVVFNDLLSDIEIDEIRGGTFDGPAQVVRAGTLGNVVLGQSDAVQGAALGVVALYSDIPIEGNIEADALGAVVVGQKEAEVRAASLGAVALYSDVLVHRKFPVPAPKTRWQSQAGRRKFPIIH